MEKYSAHDHDILARTIRGEAEIGDLDDARAIASVVMNRVRHSLWPDTPAAVCKQPKQFSCWNDGDPQRSLIETVTLGEAWFRECAKVAADALSGTLPDQTKGATHYWATYIKEPKWAKGHVPCYVNTFGRYRHQFYNDIDTPAPKSAAEALNQARPLSGTRTARGAQLAAGGTVMGGAMEAMREIDLPSIKGSLIEIMPYLPYAKWGLLAVALIGIAITAYARWDDRRRGMR